jgi:alpha-glucosidase
MSIPTPPRGKPEWWQKAVFYEIYPRSFQDSDGDGIGDIPGITKRLDYLQELGIDALWICPFFRSPMKDFGYDVSDYTEIDPLFGSREELETLLAEAHARNMRVVFDLVLNHTSNEHRWFRHSRSGAEAPKADWYIWHPGVSGGLPSFRGRPKVPNNWLSLFEMKNAWWWDETRGEYYLGTFTESQPELNWRNPEVRAAMYQVLQYWLDLGVDGFRLDVVNWLIKDDQFRNNPHSSKMKPDMFQQHIYDRNRPETHQICKELRAIADSYTPNRDSARKNRRVLIGEIFSPDLETAASYYGSENDELHMAFNYDLLYRNWSAVAFHDSLSQWYDSLPEGAWPTITLSNHDQPRHYSRFNHDDAEARARIASALLLTVRGTPFLYYGEEIGMEDHRMPKRELQDPLGKRTWPFSSLGRDPSRTPMQWDASENAGFTGGGVTPWLPINPNHTERNVEAQRADKQSLWHFYRALLRLRKGNRLLSEGEMHFMVPGTEDVLGYARSLKESSGTRVLLVLLNFSSRRVNNFPRLLEDSEGLLSHSASWEVLFGTHRGRRSALDLPVLHPYEVLLLNAR